MGRDRSLAVGEQSVEALHPHWKTLVWPVVSACVVVEAAGEHAEIILPQVPHVERVSATLFQLAEDERLRASASTQDDRRSDQR